MGHRNKGRADKGRKRKKVLLSEIMEKARKKSQLLSTVEGEDRRPPPPPTPSIKEYNLPCGCYLRQGEGFVDQLTCEKHAVPKEKP